MGGLVLIGLIWIVIDLIKEATEPTIPSGYRNNTELYRQDLYTLDSKTFQRNLKNGKYK